MNLFNTISHKGVYFAGDTLIQNYVILESFQQMHGILYCSAFKMRQLILVEHNAVINSSLVKVRVFNGATLI